MERDKKSSIKILDKVGKNLTNSDEKINLINKKVMLGVANSYYDSYLELGDPVSNDCFLALKYYKESGYETFYLLDCTKEKFLSHFENFLSQRLKDFVLFYAGHGGTKNDKNGDEKDGKDETWVFKDGELIDDDVAKCLNRNNCENVFVISDSCHSGSIVDYPTLLKKNITSFCACEDNQTSKQLAKNGIFTYFLFETAKKENKLTSIRDEINKIIRNYNQKSVIYGDREKMLLN